MGHQVKCPLEAQPLHELIQRLAEQAFEHAVEMEWGKACCLGDVLKTQGLGEVASQFDPIEAPAIRAETPSGSAA